jgi:hypothetical protein
MEYNYTKSEKGAHIATAQMNTSLLESCRTFQTTGQIWAHIHGKKIIGTELASKYQHHHLKIEQNLAICSNKISSRFQSMFTLLAAEAGGEWVGWRVSRCTTVCADRPTCVGPGGVDPAAGMGREDRRRRRPGGWVRWRRREGPSRRRGRCAVSLL